MSRFGKGFLRAYFHQELLLGIRTPPRPGLEIFESAFDVTRVCKLFQEEIVGSNLVLKHVCLQAY